MDQSFTEVAHREIKFHPQHQSVTFDLFELRELSGLTFKVFAHLPRVVL